MCYGYACMNSLKNQRLLVIAPHPDDEVLGCGGLIKKIKDHAGRVYVLFLTIGNTQDFSAKGSSTIAEREHEIEQVARYLDFDEYELVLKGDTYHLQLDIHGQKTVMDILERQSRVSIERIKPTMVVFPSQYSYNQDHQLAAKAVHAVLRPAESTVKHFVDTVLAYEVPADAWSMHHQTLPNFFVPLSNKEFAAKLGALKLYTSQFRPLPNPRAIQAVKALTRLRGILCAKPLAEAFIAYRSVL